MTSDFYRAFEDTHRGSRELIKSRLRVYLPFISPLASLHPDAPVLDLGCGRGEWLELLQDHHIAAQGIDLDDCMLEACRARGLNVLNTEALAHLAAQPDQSLLAVTGFHLAEHLPFADLQALFTQARRVLLPAGLLILETPNPENLAVGTANFYLDPTHLRPLPWALLHFLAEHHGYGRIKLLRLQEDPQLLQRGPQGLFDVLAGVSPDYAIVAQNNPLADQSPELTQAFALTTGLSLDALAAQYDQHLSAQILTHVHAAATTLRHTLDAVQHTADQALAVAQHNEARVGQLAAALDVVHNSFSWRLTRPLRWLARQLRSQTHKP